MDLRPLKPKLEHAPLPVSKVLGLLTRLAGFWEVNSAVQTPSRMQNPEPMLPTSRLEVCVAFWLDSVTSASSCRHLAVMSIAFVLLSITIAVVVALPLVQWRCACRIPKPKTPNHPFFKESLSAVSRIPAQQNRTIWFNMRLSVILKLNT